MSSTSCALDAAARVNTRENVRLTFDQKVEHVIPDIVDSNFENLLFDQYLRAHSPEPVFLKWKALESTPEGDFFVGTGPTTTKLSVDDTREFIRTRFSGQLTK